MKRSLIIRPEAETEMAEAFDWYEARVHGLGSDFLLCLDAVFNSILRNPQQFPQIHKVVRRALFDDFHTKVSANQSLRFHPLSAGFFRQPASQGFPR